MKTIKVLPLKKMDRNLGSLIPEQYKMIDENLMNLLLSSLYTNFLADYNSTEREIIQLELDNLYEPIMKPDITLTKERMLEIYYSLLHIRIFIPNTDKHPTELIPSLSMAEYDKFSSYFESFSKKYHQELDNVTRMISAAENKENKLRTS